MNSIEQQTLLNTLLAEGSNLIAKNNTEYGNQQKIMNQIVENQKALANAMANGYDPAAITAANDKLKELSTSMKTVGEYSNRSGIDVANFMRKFAKTSIIGQGLLGIANGFSLSGNAARVFVSGAISVGKVLTNLAYSVLSFPFKILQNLLDAANTSGSNELQQELENIRKEFGYLNKTAGGAIIGMSRAMKGELANTGLSTYRVFGRLVEKLQYFEEYAKALGPIFDSITTRIGHQGVEALGAFNKALGFTAEGQKAIAARALASGQTVNEVNRQIANYSLQLSEQFGLTMKQVSRAVGDMMADFEHFGHLAPKELTQVAVYARRLGIEVKALAGIMDKSFNFEDAATQAAQLSQAFGLNIDAMQQLQEQDPAKKLDNLRKAFFAAGRSIETMTAQERRLLAQQTGLDANSLDLAFSLKNQSISYDEIQKKGAAAQKAQLTQAQALEKLSGAIERLVKSGQTFQGGFVDIFLQGFNTGIRRSSEFRRIMHELRRDMHATYRAGIQVGRAFVAMFPGVRDVFQGIAQLFEPRRFREMLNSVVGSFRMFFDALTNRPGTALPDLLDKMKSGFFNYFTNGSPGARQILEGSKKFFTAFAQIANSFLKIGLTEITNWLTYASDLLTGRKSLNVALNDGGFIGRIFGTLTKGLLPVISNFFEALKTMLSDLWITKLKPWLIKSFSPILISAFAPAIIFGAARAIGASIVFSISKGILTALGKDKAIANVGSTLIQRAASTLQQAPRAVNGIEQASNVLKAAAATQQAADGIKPSSSILPKLAFAAGVVAIGLAGLFAAIYGLRKFQVTRPELLNAAILVTSMIPLMVAVGVATYTANTISIAAMSEALPALAIMGAIAAGMLASGALAVVAFKELGFTVTDVSKAALMMGALSGFYIAASAVMGVATLVGAAVATGYGAGAVAIGLATIGITVEAMVLHGMRIIKKLNEFRPSGNFQQTAGVFVNVMRAVGEFSRSIGQIASATMPGIVSIVSSSLFGTNPQEQLRLTMGKFSEIIDAIGRNITNIIDNITNHLSSMDPAVLEKGTVFADMLGGVAQMANAMAGPADLLKDTSAWWEDSDVQLKLTRFGQNIQGMGTALTSIIGAVATAVGSVGSLQASENTVNAGRLFSEILRGVGELAHALSPSREVLDAMGRAVNSGRAIEALTSIIAGTVQNMVNSGLFTQVTQFTRKIITETSSLTTQQLNQIRVVGPMVTEALKAVSSLISGVTRALPENRGTGGTTQMITSFGRTVWGSLSSISQFIKGLLPSVIEIGANVQPRALNSLKGVVSVLSPLFQAISDIPRLVTGFVGSIGEGENGTINEAAIANIGTRFGLVSAFFQRIIGLFNANDFRSSIASLGNLSLPRDLRPKMETLKATLETLNAIPATFSSLTRISGSNQDSLSTVLNGVITRLTSTNSTVTQESINTSFNNVNGLIAAVSTNVSAVNQQLNSSQLSTNIETLVTEVRNSSITRISTTVAEMVESINTTSRQLAAIRPININTELTRLAHNLGLNSDQTLRITEGRINLTINARILIEAEELETILIERPNSRIGTR